MCKLAMLLRHIETVMTIMADGLTIPKTHGHRRMSRSDSDKSTMIGLQMGIG